MKWYNEIAIDRDFEFLYTEYDNGISTTPSSASAVVYDNSGGVLENITGVIVGDEMSFTFASANNTTLGRNFKIEMTFNTDAVKTVSYLFDVVRVPIESVVTDEMLFDYIKELRNGREFTGNLDSSTVSTFTDIKLTIDSRDWKGARGTFLLDDGNIDYKATSYNATSGIITFIPTLSGALDAETRYIMRMSYQDQIDIAYTDVLSRVRGKVGPAAQYIDTNIFNSLIIYKCLETICLNAIEENGDKWSIRKDYYQECFSSTLANFNEAYDRDNDGNIDDSEEANAPTFSTIKNVRGNQNCH